MEKPQEQPKRCFCARCFQPIDSEDKIDIDGQNFHRICGTCCVCRTIPTSIKMFYGHVFCSECFKTYVMNRFKGESPRMHSNSWWMQWAPGAKPQGQDKDHAEQSKSPQDPSPPEEAKKCICARCLQAVDESNKVDIGGQSFHSQCARCYCCHSVPKDKVKIYYGLVFCEDCFHRHVMSRNKDNPQEFFRSCFEQWQSNENFNERMREFMAGSDGKSAPFVFMMQGGHSPFCRCGTSTQSERSQNNEARKCA